MEKKLSLSHISATISEQLKRLDISSGEAYLAEVTRIVDPLQTRHISKSRRYLRWLVFGSSTFYLYASAPQSSPP